jgi:DNA topoisomerase-1
MEKIQSGKLKKEEVLLTAIDILRSVLVKFKETEKSVGTELDEALQSVIRKSVTIGICPVCKTGELTIIRSRKTGKRFIGCTSFRNGSCSFSAPVPQTGVIQTTEKKCQICGFPVIVVRMKGKRPWHLCVNSKCEGKSKLKAKSVE